MLQHTFAALEEQWWEPWFAEYMRDHGLTAADLADARNNLGEAMISVIKARDPTVALRENGFSDLAPPLQAAIFMRMGQVLLASIWAGIKDISQPDSAPPGDLLTIYAQTRQAMQRLTGEVTDAEDSTPPADT